VDASAEGLPGVDGDAEPAGRSGIVAPFRDQEEPRAHFHGLEHGARRFHPIALLFSAEGGAGVQT